MYKETTYTITNKLDGSKLTVTPVEFNQDSVVFQAEVFRVTFANPDGKGDLSNDSWDIEQNPVDSTVEAPEATA